MTRLLSAMLLLTAFTVSDSGKGEEDGLANSISNNGNSNLLHSLLGTMDTLESGYFRSQPFAGLTVYLPLATRRSEVLGPVLGDSVMIGENNVRDCGVLADRLYHHAGRAVLRSYAGHSVGSCEDDDGGWLTSNIPWEGLVILPDLSAVMVDPTFAAEQASITWQESRWDCGALSYVTIGGVTYPQVGLFQLLFDSAIQKRAASLGYGYEDLLRCGPNAEVAESWYLDTQDWQRWGTKPTWRADGVSYDGY